MRIQTEDKLRLDSIAEQQMREEKILADRDLERYKRTHRNRFCEETKYMPKRRNVFVSFLSSFLIYFVLLLIFSLNGHGVPMPALILHSY